MVGPYLRESPESGVRTTVHHMSTGMTRFLDQFNFDKRFENTKNVAFLNVSKPIKSYEFQGFLRVPEITKICSRLSVQLLQHCCQMCLSIIRLPSISMRYRCGIDGRPVLPAPARPMRCIRLGIQYHYQRYMIDGMHLLVHDCSAVFYKMPIHSLACRRTTF